MLGLSNSNSFNNNTDMTSSELIRLNAWLCDAICNCCKKSTFLKSRFSKPKSAIRSNSSSVVAFLFWNMIQKKPINISHKAQRFTLQLAIIWKSTSCCASLLLGSSSRTFWKQRLAAMEFPKERWHLPSRKWPLGTDTANYLVMGV